MKHLPVLILVGLTVLLLTSFTPRVWPVLLLDGSLSALLLASAAGLGAWPARWLFDTHAPRLQRFCVALALGLGLLATLALILGSAGALNRGTSIALLALGPALAAPLLLRKRARPETKVIRVVTESGEVLDSGPEAPALGPPALSGGLGRFRLLIQSICLAPLAIPAAVMLFGATLPPGTLWQGEGGGYDVLEYHLQAPREYYDAGQIQFLPHNVYAQFPQGMETLYLLLMYVSGGPHAAAFSSQLLHAFLAILTILALAAWSPAGWTRLLMVLAAGSVSLLPYVGALAYVEAGLLFFAAVAGGIVFGELGGSPRAPSTLASDLQSALASMENEPQPPPSRRPYAATRAALAAGLCAGFAAGCKYQGAVMVALGLGLAWLAVMGGPWRPRVRRFVVFGGAALLAFSPWLIRNTAFTGNPVYPFAYAWFGGAGWSTEQADQWGRAHRFDEDAEAENRWRHAVRELFFPAMHQPGFGNMILWFVIIALMLRRSRLTALAAIWAVIIVLAWVNATHIPARFALPLLVPLAYLLAAGGVQRQFAAPVNPAASDPRATIDAVLVNVSAAGRHFGRRIITGAAVRLATALALIMAALSATRLMQSLQHEAREWQTRVGLRELTLASLAGNDRLRLDVEPLNTLPNVRRVWMVGDAAVFYITPPLHYTVAFNRDPWLEYSAANSPADAIAWLRRQNVSHVVFSWPEIERLRRTYGFSEVVSPAWVEQLAAAGLRPVGQGEGGRAGVGRQIFEVPAE